MIRGMRRGARVRAVGILSLLLASACGPGRGDVVVDRMDVALTVLVDGSVRVEERFAVRFGDVPVSSFRRLTPVWRHDGVSDVVASMDSATFSPGTGPGHVRVGKGPNLDVQWTFAPARGGTHHFTLTYRASNVVAISGIRGTVSWLVLPSKRAFDVSAASVAITLPDSAVLLQDPWVEEPGWEVTRQPQGMTARRSGLSHSESATAGVEFTIDRMAATTPRWQSDREFSAEFIPAFVSAALFVLVVGAGVLAMLRFKYPPWRVTDDAGAGPARADITPAMRLVVMRGHGRVPRALVADLVAAGLVDSDRVTAARDLRRAGVAVVLFGLVAWATVMVTLPQFGAWPLAVPCSIVIVGIMFLAGAARFQVLTEAGARARMLYFARVSDGRTSV